MDKQQSSYKLIIIINEKDYFFNKLNIYKLNEKTKGKNLIQEKENKNNKTILKSIMRIVPRSCIRNKTYVRSIFIHFFYIFQDDLSKP